MKNALLPTLLCLSFTIAASAQSRLGLRAGLNSSLLHRSVDLQRPQASIPPSIFSSRAAWHAGFFAAFSLNEHLDFQPELQYQFKGARDIHLDNLIPSRPEESFRLSLHYLTLPALLSLRWTSFVLEAGPEAGWLLGRTWRAETGDPAELDRRYPFRRFDLSFTAGFRFEVRPFFLGLRYSRGLTAVSRVSVENADGNPAWEERYFHRTLQVGAGVVLK